MWGAGQMMFNKILVLADQGTGIRDYGILAQYVFKNLDPSNDIYFSTGPMDVLDHSCSKLGFGGKMCIDGTAKTAEETDERYEAGTGSGGIENIQRAASSFPEISGVNESLLAKEIPCLIIAVKKGKKGHIKQLHDQIASMPELSSVKMILYVEHTVDVNDLPSALWRFCNNLDPKRDHHLFKLDLPNGKYRACMGFDGTRKTKEFDDFHRDWPNIIVADQETIGAVDAKWDQLGLGEFIPSPSLKFKSQMYGEEAIVDI